MFFRSVLSACCWSEWSRLVICQEVFKETLIPPFGQCKGVFLLNSNMETMLMQMDAKKQNKKNKKTQESDDIHYCGPFTKLLCERSKQLLRKSPKDANLGEEYEKFCSYLSSKENIEVFIERQHRMICNSFQEFIQSFSSGLHKLFWKTIHNAFHHKLLRKWL